MPCSAGPSFQPSQRHVDLDLCGLWPAGLSGRLVGIAPGGGIHSIELGVRAAASYRWGLGRAVLTVDHVVGFNGTVLAFCDDSAVFELSPALELHVVDLAGHGLPVANPRIDPISR